jgi:hypothetical protein
VSGQLHAPAALPQGKSPWYPLNRRLGGPQSRSGCPHRESNPRTPIVQPVAQRYTDWAITALFMFKVNYINVKLSCYIFKYFFFTFYNISVLVIPSCENYLRLTITPRWHVGDVEVKLHPFLTSPLDGGECSILCTNCFIPEERDPITNWIVGWVVPRAELDVMVKRDTPPLPETGSRSSGQ